MGKKKKHALRPKGKILPQAVIIFAFLLWTFWYATYSRLIALDAQKSEWHLIKITELANKDHEIDRLKKIMSIGFRKKDFSFSIEAAAITENIYKLQTELANRSNKTISDFTILLCTSGCILSRMDPFEDRDWFRQDDPACMALISKGIFHVHPGGLGFQKIKMECKGDAKPSKATVALFLKDSPRLEYESPISFLPNKKIS